MKYSVVPMAAPNPALEISEKVLEDARWALIERIAESQHFRSSARLRDFLFYISDCAIRESPEEATEQQIGIRVFQRHPGYNSSEDSIVRTHARILRQKLTAYFAEEGAAEPIVVDVPKGHYLPVFHPRILPETKEIHAPAVPVEVETSSAVLPAPESVSRTSFWRNWKTLALLSSMAAVVLLLLFWRPLTRQVSPPSSVDRFWQPFFSDDPPLVIFSNALFVGDSTNGLRYAPQQPQQGTQDAGNLVDTYTGIGELSSVYTLTRLFDAHQAHFVLKRSLLMTWDEAKTRNLVFIGSIAENPSLRVLESTKDFTMIAQPGSAGVVNHHPKSGEPGVYLRPEHPLTKDYAILALLPGVQQGKRMLIFSGLTTFGTQAAVEYVSRPETADELMRQVADSKGNPRYFEALLETTIGGGVPLETKLVTIRVH